MKIEDRIAKIIKYRADCVREISNILRHSDNEAVQANTMLEAIEGILDGKQVSDFMLSFPIIRRVNDMMQRANLQKNKQ